MNQYNKNWRITNAIQYTNWIDNTINNMLFENSSKKLLNHAYMNLTDGKWVKSNTFEPNIVLCQQKVIGKG